MNVTKISVNKIIPDENQPRKYFDEAKMGTLRSSIKAHGIKNPLILEIKPDGTFLIVDGERRFRAAKELGLKEIPALLHEAQNDTQRLIEQFHLQEQHESWTPTEKAVAISKLADIMEISAKEVGLLLGIPARTINTYIAFGNIIDKANFQKSRVNLGDASQINGIKTLAKKMYEAHDIEFTRTTGKQIENAIYVRIRNGENVGKSFYSHIRDSIVKDPKSLEKFLENDEMTVDKLFSETKARGAYHLRHIRFNSTYLRKSIAGFLKEKDVKIDSKLISELKACVSEVQDFIRQFDE